MDDDGVAHVLCSTATGEVVLLRIDGMERDQRIRRPTTSRTCSAWTGRQQHRSPRPARQLIVLNQPDPLLAGQDTGRVNVPSTAIEDAVCGRPMLMGDLNDDGFDDIVINPEADLVSMTDNGRVAIYYG